jgi:hypothetical protein
MAGFYKNLTGGPSILIDKQTLHLPHATIRCLDVISQEHPATAQVSVTILLAQVRIRFRPRASPVFSIFASLRLGCLPASGEAFVRAKSTINGI